MESILMKIARRMKPTQTNERNEIFASRATFLYRHRGITTETVARKITNSRLTKKLSGSRPDTLIKTFVTVSPTTTLYDTIATIKHVGIFIYFLCWKMSENIFLFHYFQRLNEITLFLGKKVIAVLYLKRIYRFWRRQMLTALNVLLARPKSIIPRKIRKLLRAWLFVKGFEITEPYQWMDKWTVVRLECKSRDGQNLPALDPDSSFPRTDVHFGPSKLENSPLKLLR